MPAGRRADEGACARAQAAGGAGAGWSSSPPSHSPFLPAPPRSQRMLSLQVRCGPAAWRGRSRRILEPPHLSLLQALLLPLRHPHPQILQGSWRQKDALVVQAGAVPVPGSWPGRSCSAQEASVTTSRHLQPSSPHRDCGWEGLLPKSIRSKLLNATEKSYHFKETTLLPTHSCAIYSLLSVFYTFGMYDRLRCMNLPRKWDWMWPHRYQGMLHQGLRKKGYNEWMPINWRMVE
ncbi:uncharacterized protein LOC127540672 isoform X1 [Antechinus flavipes]|uniref:uncharacterized protein LOC127540672 isoform X1 n=1 Tax=Antechinus flavipes TaxID=38775 RepID=UPI002235DCFE|nr:uncharacterized protein LOC127540672 isoform X1 [Antechinus flavipes]